MRRWEAEAKWYVHQKSSVCDFGKVWSVPKPSNNRPLRQAWTRERIPNEDGSRWLIAGHGIQVSMPGILEPYPNQSDECMCRGQFKEGDDPDANKNVQHWNNWGNWSFESRCLWHGYQHQRGKIEFCGRLPHLLDDVPKLGSLVQQLGGVLGRLLWECLTACKALSHANEKGKGIDSKGWAFRMR